jgi:hypothetical protein
MELLYSSKIIESPICFVKTVYSQHTSKHMESLVCIFQDDVTKKEKKYYLYRDEPTLSGWMKLLDFGDSGAKKASEILAVLHDILGVFGMEGKVNSLKGLYLFDYQACIENYIQKHTKDRFIADADRVLQILKGTADQMQAVHALYPVWYMFLKKLYLIYSQQNSKTLIDEAANTFSFAVAEIIKLPQYLIDAHGYAEAVFEIPDKIGANRTLGEVINAYSRYCRQEMITPFYSDIRQSLYGIRIDTGYDEEGNKIGKQSWENFLSKDKEMLLDEVSGQFVISGIYDYLQIGCYLMIEKNRSIRKCKLCGGYFLTYTGSDRDYCSRIYRNSSKTCSEYVFHRGYKKRLAAHPIHAEYIKSYNRLYGRVRRGTVLKESPLFEQLKQLHEDYYERYENAEEKDRKEIIQKYIRENKKL